MKSKNLIFLRIVAIIDIIGLMIALSGIFGEFSVSITIILVIIVQMYLKKILERIGLKTLKLIVFAPIITPLLIIFLYILYTIILYTFISNDYSLDLDKLIDYVITGEILILPISITIKNIIRILRNENKNNKGIFDIICLMICFLYTYTTYGYIETDINNNEVYLDYNINTTIVRHTSTIGEPIYHAPLASWSMPTIITILSLGIISYLILRLNRRKMPPLIATILLSNTIICSTYMLLFIIQIAFAHNYLNDVFLLIFPVNYILCTIKLQIDIVNTYKANNKKEEHSNIILNKISNIVYNTENISFASFVMTIPILTILICILYLFGQRPDEAIRAFFETSDWNLSTFVSPQIPVEYVGHYLCTVSLKGHKRIVKPTRVGIRYGNKIIVNRQLCIANAFEDLIKEKTPRFHLFIRTIYDKYGYPLSKHINQPWQADLIYILMKPLEWIFLIVLYLFDVKPENRIATQYIGNTNKKIIESLSNKLKME